MWSAVSGVAPKHIDNKSLVIVLIDSNVASSGEGFIGFLRQMDNVIFVGVPTEGCLTAGNIGHLVLTESSMIMRFGVKLNIRPDLSEFEGNGFMPDLWVPPGERLDYVLKFIERYGLNK